MLFCYYILWFAHFAEYLNSGAAFQHFFQKRGFELSISPYFPPDAYNLPCGVLGRGNNPSDVFMYESDWRRLFEISSLKSRSARFENGTEKARKQRNENSKRLIRSKKSQNACFWLFLYVFCPFLRVNSRSTRVSWPCLFHCWFLAFFLKNQGLNLQYTGFSHFFKEVCPTF